MPFSPEFLASVYGENAPPSLGTEQYSYEVDGQFLDGMTPGTPDVSYSLGPDVDLNGDNFTERTGWLYGDDGFLADDANAAIANDNYEPRRLGVPVTLLAA